MTLWYDVVLRFLGQSCTRGVGRRTDVAIHKGAKCMTTI